MVDVSNKQASRRHATASGDVTVASGTFSTPQDLSALNIALPVVALVAQRAVHLTSQLIPLCHPLPLAHPLVDIAVGRDVITITVTTALEGVTGVEMEALAGVGLGALELIAQFSAIGITAEAGRIAVTEKAGGRSGTWRRTPTGEVIHLEK